MSRCLKLAVAALFAASLAACAQSTAQPSFEPPQRKQTDAKTQLESGRRF